MDNDKIHIPIKELEQRFKSVLIRVPAIIGNVALNFFLDSFKRQGFLGTTFLPWRKRKNPTKWGTAPKRNGRALLVLTGKMRRSIRVVRTTTDAVVIGSDDPKIKAHNEGLRIGQIQTVESFTRKGVGKKTVNVKSFKRRVNVNIPKRQMIGNSPYLNKLLHRMVGAEIMKAIKR